jgi:hypothetical protein
MCIPRLLLCLPDGARSTNTHRPTIILNHWDFLKY